MLYTTETRAQWEPMIDSAIAIDSETTGLKSRESELRDRMHAMYLSMMTEHSVAEFNRAWSWIAEQFQYDPNPTRGGKKNGAYAVIPSSLRAVRSLISRAIQADVDPTDRKSASKTLAKRARDSKTETEKKQTERDTAERENGRRLAEYTTLLVKHARNLETLLQVSEIDFPKFTLGYAPVWLCNLPDIDPAELQAIQDTPMPSEIPVTVDGEPGTVIKKETGNPKRGTRKQRGNKVA